MKPETARSWPRPTSSCAAIEHRIQYLDDQQTHLLPTGDADLAWIAASLGLGCKPAREACELLDRLGEVRELVATEFDALLHDGQAPAPAGGCKHCGPARCRWTARAARAPAAGLAERVCALGEQPRVQALRDESKLRLGRLVRAGQARGDGDCTRGRRPALHRLARTAAAPRQLPGACWSSGPRCSAACCACWAWRAGRCST
jgi:glutamate-ammonia-ligase adenylyltransferase